MSENLENSINLNIENIENFPHTNDIYTSNNVVEVERGPVRFAIVGWDEEAEKFLDFYNSLQAKNATLTAVHTGKIKSEFIFDSGNLAMQNIMLADSFKMDIDMFIMDKSFELIFLFGTPPQCSNISRKAIAIGKHVVCNKLVSLSSKEAHQLVDSLLSYPSLFCVAMNPLRSLPLADELRLILGLNGNRVKHVVCRVQSNVPVRRFNFFKQDTEENAKKSYKYVDSFWYNIYSKDKGCGCLYEVTSYYIDFFSYVLQTEFHKVRCSIRQLNCYPLPKNTHNNNNNNNNSSSSSGRSLRTDCDDYNTVVLEYESGHVSDIVQVELEVNCCTHMLSSNKNTNKEQVSELQYNDVHRHSMQILLTDACINVQDEHIDVCYFNENESVEKIKQSLEIYSHAVCEKVEKEVDQDLWTKGEKLFYLNVFESYYLRNVDNYPTFLDSYKSLLMIGKCKASSECKNWQYVDSVRSFSSAAATPLKKSPSKETKRPEKGNNMFYSVVKKAGLIIQLSSQVGKGAASETQNKDALKKRQTFAQMSGSAEINYKSSS